MSKYTKHIIIKGKVKIYCEHLREMLTYGGINFFIILVILENNEHLANYSETIINIYIIA